MEDNLKDNRAGQPEQKRVQENPKKNKNRPSSENKHSENDKMPHGSQNTANDPGKSKQQAREKNKKQSVGPSEKTNPAKNAVDPQAPSGEAGDVKGTGKAAPENQDKKEGNVNSVPKLKNNKAEEKMLEGFSRLDNSIQESARLIIEEFRRNSAENSRLLEEKRNLAVKLTTVNTDIASLNKAKSDIERSLARKTAELAGKEAELRAALTRIDKPEQQLADMSQQLDNVQEMNEAMSGKARTAFAEKLKNSLMVSYEDFMDYADAPCSDVNYDTYRAIIRSIFRTLASNGIKFTEE